MIGSRFPVDLEFAFHRLSHRIPSWLILFGLVCLSVLSFRGSVRGETISKPHIVLIMADDKCDTILC